MKAFLLAGLLALSMGASAQSVGTLTVVEPNTWRVERGYIVHQPDGSTLACKMAEWDGTLELPPEEVLLDCSFFEPEFKFIGSEDGSLRGLPK